MPLNTDYTNELNSLIASDTVKFTALKPLLFQEQFISDSSQVGFLVKDWLVSSKYRNLKQRLLNGNFYEIHKDHVDLVVNPIFTGSLGKANRQQGVNYLWSRGIGITGKVNQKVYFNTSFWENQAKFPLYVDSVIRKNIMVVPGQGKAKGYKNNGFDFSRSEAYLLYSASPLFKGILGYGKNFIGDGYRSLLLSDNSFSYPFLKLQSSFWRLSYSVIYSQYMNPRYLINDSYQRKFSTIHYLNYNVSKRFQVGLFEAIIWQSKDSTSLRGFDLQYLNPILFLRPTEFSIGSTDNALLGLNFKYNASRKTFLYSQVLLDDINISETLKQKQQHLNNKYGLQLGIWTKDLFVPNLTYRMEYNTVRPFTYGHRKVNQNYTHYSQALAHPLGANFHEIVNNVNYRRKRFTGEFHSITAFIGEDYDNRLFGNNLWGGEAGVPLFGSKTLDGLETKLFFNQLTIGWTVNPAYNLKFQAQVANRTRKNSLNYQSETFFSLGVVTSFFNTYHDF